MLKYEYLMRIAFTIPAAPFMEYLKEVHRKTSRLSIAKGELRGRETRRGEPSGESV
jgi:hypothetical protein